MKSLCLSFVQKGSCVQLALQASREARIEEQGSVSNNDAIAACAMDGFE